MVDYRKRGKQAAIVLGVLLLVGFVYYAYKYSRAVYEVETAIDYVKYLKGEVEKKVNLDFLRISRESNCPPGFQQDGTKCVDPSYPKCPMKHAGHHYLR